MSLSADMSVCGDDESNLEVASYLYDRAWFRKLTPSNLAKLAPGNLCKRVVSTCP